MIVGGLVPNLLIPSANLGPGGEPHLGTKDLDLGLGFGILDRQRYGELVTHLLAAHFHQDVTDKGTPANHRWRHRDENVMVDFLIASSGISGPNPHVRVIDDNLSAVLAEGLPLAFRDRRPVKLTGTTLGGEEATRSVWVSGAGAFLAMKALAFRIRGHPKDAYDLLYVVQNYGSGYQDVADDLAPLLDDAKARAALEIIREDFTSSRSLGPMRAAEFIGRTDAGYRSDLAGAATELVRLLSARTLLPDEEA